ncbi:hypothetical protein NUW58_g877 [Xylaria curta]|uniref:Uncharacterized protein n=1 Tax=Xylaria curta TaxID=42375 RepID=A0ACC1PNK2_9PEZI|nr:hypothetical protein NUW58_g877 [Xylaria curta]
MTRPNLTDFNLKPRRQFRKDWIGSHPFPTLIDLENSQHIRRARNAAGHITRLTADEERPAALLSAMFGQFFEVEEFADRAAPAGEEHLVQSPGFLRRPALKGRLIARDGLDDGIPD